jgi:uncharacterized delta-60 repeat protein
MKTGSLIFFGLIFNIGVLLAPGQPALVLDADFNPTFGPGRFWPSIAVPQSDGKVLVGGAFTSVNGTDAKFLARLRADGNLDANFRPVLPESVNLIVSLALDRDGKVVVLGMDTRDQAVKTWLTRLLSDGSVDSGFQAQVSPVQEFVLTPDNKIVVSGASWTENGTTRSGIARLKSDGTIDRSFQATVSNGEVVGVFPDRGLLVRTDAPPEVVSLAGTSALAPQHVGKHCEIHTFLFIRLNADGSEDKQFNRIHYNRIEECPSPFNVHVRQDGTILVGGQFSRIDDHIRPGLARLDPSGLVDDTFVPQWDRSALLIAVGSTPQGPSEPVYILGGHGAQEEGVIARFDSSGGLQSKVRFNLSGGWIYGMTVSGDGSIFLRGDFTHFNGQPRSGLARFRRLPVLRSPRVSSAGFTATIGGEPGWAYIVETSTDLVNWTFARELPSTGANTEFKDPERGDRVTQFYRVGVR